MRSKNASLSEGENSVTVENNSADNDNEKDDTEYEAATKIQAAYRGHKVRSKTETNEKSSASEKDTDDGQEAQNPVTNAISTSSNDEQKESGNYQLKRT